MSCNVTTANKNVANHFLFVRSGYQLWFNISEFSNIILQNIRGYRTHTYTHTVTETEKVSLPLYSLSNIIIPIPSYEHKKGLLLENSIFTFHIHDIISWFHTRCSQILQSLIIRYQNTFFYPGWNVVETELQLLFCITVLNFN